MFWKILVEIQLDFVHCWLLILKCLGKRLWLLWSLFFHWIGKRVVLRCFDYLTCCQWYSQHSLTNLIEYLFRSVDEKPTKERNSMNALGMNFSTTELKSLKQMILCNGKLVLLPCIYRKLNVWRVGKVALSLEFKPFFSDCWSLNEML